MRKRLALVLAVALLALFPICALGEETSVSDHCQEAAQAETSEAMVQEIDAAFEALKVEARADEGRAADLEAEVLDFNDEDEEPDENLRLYIYTIARDGKQMRFIMGVKGEPDASGYPLYLTLHGGGTTTPEENDTEWYSMYDYYRSSVDHGIYIACRGMEDVWNMHSLPDAYAMYDRIIEDMVLLKNADPNRVYLLGFSAGGDGVYQVSPRMADRFAAANMSSGHPNDVSLLNVANVPFEIQVGVRDYYSPSAMRNISGAEFQEILNGYHDTYGFGYEHRVLVHVPDGHNLIDNAGDLDLNTVVLTDPTAFANRSKDEDWLRSFVGIYSDFYGGDPDDAYAYPKLVTCLSYESEYRSTMGLAEEDKPAALQRYADFCAAITKKVTGTGDGEYAMETEVVDTDAVHYVNRFVRTYCPRQLVWDLATRAAGRKVSSFYWLRADASVDAGLITASFDADTNTFTLDPSDDVAGDFQILINPHMVDVSEPVTFVTPKGTFTMDVEADQTVVEDSLREVTDPYLAWVQEVSYEELDSSEEPPVPDEPVVRTHEYTAEGGGTWTMGSSDTLSFTFERVGEDRETFDHFVGVRVDDEDLANDAYDAYSGSVVVSLMPGYLETLEVGDHSITAVFDDGEATTEFSIEEAAPIETDEPAPTPDGEGPSSRPISEAPAPSSRPTESIPETGDAALPPAVWMAVLGAASLAAALHLELGRFVIGQDAGRYARSRSARAPRQW